MALKLGILSVAHLHATSYVANARQLPGVDLVGVWDDHVDRARAFCEPFGVPFFENKEHLLNQVDAVCICSENSNHRRDVEAAALHRKHILCEKPLAVHEEDGPAMLKAAADAGVILMTAFPCPFAPAFESLLIRVRRGDIGRVLAVAATNHGRCPFGWFVDPELSGGGAMIDHTVHVADLFRRLMGCEPVSVQAFTGNNMYRQAWDDTAMLTLEFADGTFATLDSSWSRPSQYKTWGDVTLTVTGEKGVIEVDLFGVGLDLTRESGFALGGYGSDLDRLMVSEFVRAVSTYTAPRVTGEDGWQAARVALAGYRSAELGQPVALA